MAGSTAIPANLGPQPIEHLVVLMLENRSFDLVLGTLYPASPSFDGLTDVMGNADSAGDPLLVGPAPGTITDPDPHHDLASVVEQITGPNQGFVVNYEGRLGPGQWPLRRQVLDYATETTMPVLWRLAREYAVSDRWFCSVPAETWPNRLFVHCGTSLGKVSDRPWRWLPPSLYPATSIFARLGPELSAWACYNDRRARQPLSLDRPVRGRLRQCEAAALFVRRAQLPLRRGERRPPAPRSARRRAADRMDLYGPPAQSAVVEERAVDPL